MYDFRLPHSIFMLSRHLFIAVFILSLCFLSLQARPSCAQSNYLPSPYVPWIEGQGFARQDLEEPGKQTTRKKDRAWHEIPDDAVLTPRETMDLIERLEQDTATTEPLSALEQTYSRRAGEELHQFGYELFAAEEKDDPTTKKQTIPSGAVQDDFILNSGDKLNILFRGQRKSSGTYTINDEGTIAIEDLPPITAAGMSISDLREHLNDHASQLYNTDVFVSLDAVRQINILVIGHVKKPGRKTMTVFHSVLDALAESGGIDKTGSLRQIKLVRHGRSTIIDLYGLLVHGSVTMDLGLQDGDKLIIPPIGPTVGIAGGVKRPAIYEITKQPGKLTLEQMLDMAGGKLSPGQDRTLRLGLTDKGEETVTQITKIDKHVFGDGTILMVAPSRETRAGTVELTGHTRRPGIHDLDKAPSLAKLLDDEKVMGPDIYPLIAVIERRDPEQMSKKIIDFPPLHVIKGSFDRKLQDGDVVHLFSREQIISLQNENKNKTDETLSGLEPAAGPLNDKPIHDPVLESFLNERAAFVRGAVRQEGAYPVAAGVSLDNLIAAAGGLTLEANTRNIEVTSALGHNAGTIRKRINYEEDDPHSIMLEPGDTVRVNQRFHKIAEQSVTIIGEVSHPGQYDLMPGDKLSDLMRRAGGLTPQAYPEGAIFSRASERKAEESRFRSAARDLERALAIAMEDEDKAPDTNQIAMARDLAAELRQVEAVGRITVEADPGVLVTHPSLDMLLETGDRIFVPRRPLTVRVNGEVLSPAALQFRTEKSARDYISEAGSYTYHADKDRVFVLYPDGSAQPLAVSAWNHSAVFIPPGSTIVVPRDPKPFDFIQSARDISQILSNLAITGIFLDDITDD